MYKIFSLLVFSFLWFSSCVSTKTSIRQYCKACLDPDDGIIIDEVASPMLSVMQNNEIWDIMKLVFQKEGFTNVYDRYELDYQFFNNNIKGIDSQEDREQLARKLGIKYILKPAVLDVRESDGFVYDALNTNAEYSFPREVYPIPNKPAGNQANLKYELIETSSGEVVYRVDFTNSYSANIDEDGINHDYGTVMRTLRSGTKKGTRFTIADCSCPKKKYIKRRKFWEKLGY